MRSWREYQLVGYGAIELKKIYGKNISRSFFSSAVFSFAVAAIVWALLRAGEAKPERTLRIIAYEEFVLPSNSTTALGMTAYPALPFSEENAFDPATQTPVPTPKGIQTKKFALPPREFAQMLGDLPSVGTADRADQSSPGIIDPPVGAEGRIGGSNNTPQNNQQGGTPVPGFRDGGMPSGGGRSGIGSASKPSPGHFVAPTGDPYGTPNGSGGGSGFALEWLQGGTRKKLSGNLPVYPSGVTVEAELTFYATVDPDGTMKAVLPAQKADIRLERAVIDALRDWKFEALPTSFPQVEQTCLLKFIFQLK